MGASRPVVYLPQSASGERQLVEGLRRGEVACYRQLYDLYAPRLGRTLERLYRDPHLAQDAVQATFLAVFRNIHHFDGRSTLLTWMTRIALREGGRLSRRQARAQRMAESLPPASPRPWGEEQHDDRQRLRRLEALLDELPLEKRMALLLFEVEGFSVQEIADITGEPRGTVLSRLSRTRAELRQALSEGREASPHQSMTSRSGTSSHHV
ncbi:MAG: sigma-70 family RNA polymerase sigma factor [Myxococcales bacterium]|nr:sigma-70 family RNA polymerase sigma factor [Myxococcota bacterium]MDW8280182.1 sigma-70 family RNA polymerase sigma factor [Myxococcales bacterium]